GRDDLVAARNHRLIELRHFQGHCARLKSFLVDTRDEYTLPLPTKHCRKRHAIESAEGALLMRLLILAAALVAASNGVVRAQDAAAGEGQFRQCRACHTVGPDARNLVGPELNGLDGRKAGSVDGFSYSDANKNSGIVWNEATFKEYIANPLAKIPGTKMQFV